MTKGLTTGKKFVTRTPELDDPRVTLYKFRYTMPSTDPSTGEVCYIHFLSNGSTFMDNLSRNFDGEKYFYNQWVPDFPRNEKGNIVDEEPEPEPTKKKQKVR